MFGKKKKKKNLEYSWFGSVSETKLDEDLSKSMIDNFLTPAIPKSSCWFSNMKSTVGDYTSIIEKIKHDHQTILNNNGEFPNDYETNYSAATAKTCPAVLSFFKKTYLLKFPYDVIISVKSDGSFMSQYSVDDNLLKTESHGSEQFRTFGDCDLFENKINVKFCFGVNIRTDNIPWTFIQPIYHNDQPFVVAPGIVDGNQTTIQNLNLITFFDIPKEGVVHHHFKAGEVLAYIMFNEKVDLKYVPYNMKRKYFPKGFRNKFI